MEAEERNILGYEKIGKLLKLFAWPAIISMLANSLYNIIDQIFIGQAVGYLGNAATTIAFPIVTIVLALGAMLGVGGSAFAAIKLGEGQREVAEKTLNSVTTAAFLVGVLLMAGGLVWLEPLLTIFGATEQTMTYSKEFGGVMIAIIPMTMLVIGLSNLARADGSPRLAMRALVSGVLLNIVLAPLFIFKFGLGVLGAALATACAQFLSLTVFVWYFSCKGKMRFHRKYLLQPDLSICRRVMTIGLSSCIIQSGATLLQIGMNNSLLYYGNLGMVGGDLAISAMGIVMKVNMIVISICVGIGAGAQPIIGFNRGAGAPRRVKEAYLLSVRAASGVTVAGWLCCQLFPGEILSIFGSNGENFLTFAVSCMRLFLGGVFLAGFQIISTSYFQSTGQPLKASILSMLRQLLLLMPLIFLLPLWFGLEGILYAGLISDLAAGAIVAIFMRKEMRKLNAEIKNHAV